eukprot:jgi/Chrzof1/10752/Cz05g10320.t1
MKIYLGPLEVLKQPDVQLSPWKIMATLAGYLQTANRVNHIASQLQMILQLHTQRDIMLHTVSTCSINGLTSLAVACHADPMPKPPPNATLAALTQGPPAAMI